AILVIPLFDTLRVFTVRIKNGKSPLSADRNHLHHLLLTLGYSHMKSTSILVSFNVFIVWLVFHFQYLRGEILLFVLLCACLISSLLLTVAVRRKLKLVL